MSTLSIDTLSFHHADPFAQVFTDISLQIETTWRTGLVGRNGRGKTTLLGLLRGELTPVRGKVSVPVEITHFPYEPRDRSARVLDLVREAVAPFAMWERRMEELLAAGDESSL